MQRSGDTRAIERRFRRRLAVAAVAIGAIAGLAMPFAGADGRRASASAPPAVHA
jgi:hypothetical protein